MNWSDDGDDDNDDFCQAFDRPWLLAGHCQFSRSGEFVFNYQVSMLLEMVLDGLDALMLAVKSQDVGMVVSWKSACHRGIIAVMQSDILAHTLYRICERQPRLG